MTSDVLLLKNQSCKSQVVPMFRKVWDLMVIFRFGRWDVYFTPLSCSFFLLLAKAWMLGHSGCHLPVSGGGVHEGSRCGLCGGRPRFGGCKHLS